MGIAFNSSERSTIGVEWELQLVDERTRHLRQEAPKLLSELPELSSETSASPLRHELMQSQVEVVTGICETVEEARIIYAIVMNLCREEAVRAPD